MILRLATPSTLAASHGSVMLLRSAASAALVSLVVLLCCMAAIALLPRNWTEEIGRAPAHVGKGPAVVYGEEPLAGAAAQRTCGPGPVLMLPCPAARP